MRRPARTPGFPGDSFGERLAHGRSAAGAVGQFTQLDHPFTFIENPRDIADANKLGCVFGVPDFLWVAGDGNVPTIGPALNVTGTPDAAISPYQLVGGSNVASEAYDGTEYRTTATVLDPSAGDDIIAYCLFKGPALPVGVQYLIGNRIGGGGWRLYISPTRIKGTCDDGVVTLTESFVVASTAAAWMLAMLVIDGDGNFYVFVNQSVTAGQVTPAAGALGSGGGIGLAAFPSGASPFGAYGQILFAGFRYGAGIADEWIADSFALAKAFVSSFTGISAKDCSAVAYLRHSDASWQDRNGIWHIAGEDTPRAGDDDGFRVAPARTNMAYHNVNPQVGDAAAALTWTGAVAPTEVSDAVPLWTDGAEIWGPNVFEYANSTGGVQHIRMSAQLGNVNPHSLQCLIRITAGAGAVKLGLYNEVGGAFAGSAIHDGYDTRTIVANQTPAAATCTMCLEVPNGVTIRWIAHDVQEGEVTTMPIPNWANAATAARLVDSLILSKALPDEQGSFECDITPMGWSAGDLASSLHVVKRSSFFPLSAWAGNTWGLYDGVNTADTGSPADGVEAYVRTRWKNDAMSSVVDSSRDDTPYDGGFAGAEATLIRIEPVQSAGGEGGEVRLKNLRFLRNGDG